MSGRKRKLTAEQTRELMRLVDLHRQTCTDRLAERFRVHPRTIEHYVRRAREVAA